MVLNTQQFIEWLTGVGMDADDARSFVDALNDDRAALLTAAEFTAAISDQRGRMAEHYGETRALMRELLEALLTQMATMRADVIEAMDLEAERSADRVDAQIGAWRNQTIPVLRLVVGLGLANFAAVVAVLIRLAF